MRKRYLPLLFVGLAAVISGCLPEEPVTGGANMTMPEIDQNRPALTERATFSLG